MPEYTVINESQLPIAQEYAHLGSGWSAIQALKVLMLAARYEYAFVREDGEMVLTVTPNDGSLSLPSLRSKLSDDVAARAEIIQRFIGRESLGMKIVPDHEWRRLLDDIHADEERDAHFDERAAMRVALKDSGWGKADAQR